MSEAAEDLEKGEPTSYLANICSQKCRLQDSRQILKEMWQDHVNPQIIKVTICDYITSLN